MSDQTINLIIVTLFILFLSYYLTTRLLSFIFNNFGKSEESNMLFQARTTDEIFMDNLTTSVERENMRVAINNIAPYLAKQITYKNAKPDFIDAANRIIYLDKMINFDRYTEDMVEEILEND